MKKIWHYVFFILFITVSSVGGTQSHIILEMSDSKNTLDLKKINYDQVIQESSTLQKIEAQEGFEAHIVALQDRYLLKVGPFVSGDALALVYLHVRNDFPRAFIEEKKEELASSAPEIQYIDRKVIVEKEDETLWTALFGLAIIGILALFLSSDQLKNLKLKHAKIQKRQSEIEQKQSLLLEKMGEKIQTVALKNVNSEKKILETSLEEIDKEEIIEHIDEMKRHDEKLLRATYEMIDFLKIKSGNIVIKQEAFQLSNMLHKLTNSVSDALKSKEHTLKYHIHNDVTRYLVGDTDRIFQVLHNLLTDILSHQVQDEIILNIEVEDDEYLVFTLVNKNQYLTQTQIDKLFIPASWEEIQDKNKEFGFFVLNELISNMEGKFHIDSTKKHGTTYTFSLPYIQDVESKSHKGELQKLLLAKKAMVVDNTQEDAEILTGILESFNIDVAFKTSESLATHKPKLEGIDFLVIKAEDISKKVFNFFRSIDKALDIDIIVIHSIYEVDNSVEITSHISDAELFSPLIIGDVEEVLKQLCIKKDKKKKEEIREELSHFRIKDVAKVSRVDFQKFRAKKILLVEDNLVSQQVMGTILAASNLEIFREENGVQALRFLDERDDIDMIFLDIDMPVMDGFEAAKKIRQHPVYKDVPIVAVTGLGFNYEMEQMILAGINACIIKPFKVGQLYIALESYLEFNGEYKKVYRKAKKEKFHEAKGILDVTKGVSYVRSESFYREIVTQVGLALKNSEKHIKELIENQEIDKLRTFCIDALGLSSTIGANSFVVLLNNMLYEMNDVPNPTMKTYIKPYRDEWVKLDHEIKRYLKS